MDMMPVKPERKAQLEEYAQRHGQDAVAALDDVLAAALEWERQEFDETVAGVLAACEEVKAGRTRPAPARCALAPENASVPFEMRQLLYGSTRHRYRILFTIDGGTVYILRIRRPRQRHLSLH